MPTKEITQKSVEALKPGQTIWDTQIRGLGCRCQKKTKVFVLKYRNGSGRSARQRYYTIGVHGSPWTVKTVRQEAKKLQAKILEGSDPAGEKQVSKKVEKLGEAFEAFIKDGKGKKKPSTLIEYERVFGKYIEPDHGPQRITDFMERDAHAIHRKLSKIPVQANRILQMMKAFFNWCEEVRLRTSGSNPYKTVKRYKEKPKERYLDDAELFRLGEALNAYLEERTDNLAALYIVSAIRLIIFTGARRGEILGLKWEDIDFDRSLIRLQESKTDQKTIYLSSPALETLNNIPKMQGNPYVICGRKTGAHLVNIKDPWLTIRKKAGLEDVRIHDLRHTYGSFGVSVGHHLKVVGSLLGHSSIKTTERYAHLADDPVKAANEVVSQRIADAMQSPSNKKVVKIKKQISDG